MRVVSCSVVLVLLSACGSSGDAGAPAAAGGTASPTPTTGVVEATDTVSTTGDELHPDVVGAEAIQEADGTWRFDVTLSSPYDSPERYADAWRVLAPDGTELGVRLLTHDHANEQPFTRSLNGVAIPDGIDIVTIEGRDQVSGWGGATLEVQLRR